MAALSDSTLDELPPRANSDLLGHDGAEAALLAAWHSGRMPHAWLIAGPRGIGKATLAFRLARFALAGGGGGGLFGDAPTSLAISAGDPVFRRVAAGGHADLMSLEPGMVHPDTNKPTQEIVVGHVRQAAEFLRKTAAEGGWRVVIVDEAEAMNRNAANALLKILEEPPPRCLLLLVSHSAGRLLPTIRSRCRLLMLAPLGPEIVKTLLARHRPELDPAERDLLVQIADGSIGRAIELADRGGAALEREIESFLAALPALDIPALYDFADRFAGPGENASGFRTALELIEAALARRLKEGPRGTEAWLAAQDRLRRLAGATEGLNLDRRLALLATFFALQGAARMSQGR